jgi:hypothetical protein
VLQLLERAALDGHTAVPLELFVVGVLGARGLADVAGGPGGGELLSDPRVRGPLDEAVNTGSVVVVENGWLALDALATAEQSIADELAGLASEGRLTVTLERASARPDAGPLGNAHRLDAVAMAELLQAVGDGEVELRGDPDVLGPRGPGAPLRDVVESGMVPVTDNRAAAAGAAKALESFVRAVRTGSLPQPDPADRSVVVVPCETDDDIVRRVEQLVGDSIPRALGIPPRDIAVLTPLRRGGAGAVALAERVGSSGARVSTIHGAAWGDSGHAPAVVACFPGQAAGVLTRALVYSAAVAAERHLSIVTASGEDLPRAVADAALGRRRTRLVDPLRAASG